MKTLFVCLTAIAFATVSLQAGEGKECAATCSKTAKVAKASECSKTAKAGECSKSASACSSKKANATAKGATQLLAKR